MKASTQSWTAGGKRSIPIHEELAPSSKDFILGPLRHLLPLESQRYQLPPS